MACNNCGKRMAREWTFCPYCGTEITRERGLFESIENMFKSLFSGQRGVQFNPKKGPKITFKFMGPNGQERVIRNVQPKDQVKITTSPKSMKMPSELVEPEADVKRQGSDLEVIIELPGVKSLRNVMISRMGESIEVRAVSKNKGYFKIINVPEQYEIRNKTIKNETLTVRLSK